MSLAEAWKGRMMTKDRLASKINCQTKYSCCKDVKAVAQKTCCYSDKAYNKVVVAVFQYCNSQARTIMYQLIKNVTHFNLNASLSGP